MKIVQFVFICLWSTITFTQSNTEIFIFDITYNSNSIELKNGKNITNNEGYDNQPAFIDNNRLIYASTRNGQTDIAQHFLNYNSKSWVNFTQGSEYTPLKIPNKNALSAIRLDNDGKQRLYNYSLSNGESTELIKDLAVAYYTWFNEDIIVSVVIEGNDLNLYINNVKNNTNKKITSKIGRSFHNIPNSNLVSFISKANPNQWQIKSLNPITGTIKTIANTIKEVEDICWLDSKTILSSKGSSLYKLRLQKDNDWKKVKDLAINGISKITRLTSNASVSKLAIVADISNSSVATTQENENAPKAEPKKPEENTTPNNNTNEASKIEAIVQKQLDAYNARDLEAFMDTYANDVKLYNYPNELKTEGKTAMKKSYKDWFERVPDLRAFIKKRIVIGNKVIDEEQVTANGKIFNAVAIYEIENSKIVKVTFIQ